MIHGAKLLNKNKTRKVLFAKNKKNQKKFFLQKSRIDSVGVSLEKKGTWSNICPNTKTAYKYSYNTDVSHIY